MAGRGRWLALPAAAVSLAAILVAAVAILGLAGGGSAQAQPVGPLLVVKSCPQESAVGQPVIYNIGIANTSGSETLSINAVNDPLFPLGGDILSSFGDLELSPGEFTVSDSLLRFVQEGDPKPLTNTVTVDAVGTSSGPLSAQASCTLDVASLTLTKTAVFVNDTVIYTFVITNDGNVPLQRAFVTDTVLGDITIEFPASLAVGESVTVVIEREFDDQECDNTVTADYQSMTQDIHSRVIVSAECDTAGGPDFIASKVCSPKTGTVGDPINVVVQVTNIGTDPLTSVSAVDDHAALAFSSGDDGDDILEPGEVWVYTGSYNPATAGSFTNKVTVQATDPGGTVIERTDTDTCVRDEPPNGAQLTPTGTDCTDFRDQSAGDQDSVLYDVRNDKISNAVPGVFFYFTEVTTNSTTDKVSIDQSSSIGAWKEFEIKFLRVWDPKAPPDDCAKLFTVGACGGKTDCTFELGLTGTVIVQVQYDSKSIKGSSPITCVAGTPTSVSTYTWTTKVEGTPVQSDSLDVKPKAGATC